MKKRFMSIEFLKFILTGGTATAIHLIMFYTCKNILNIENNIAYSLGYMISMIFNYMISLKFTFNESHSIEKAIRFIGAHLTNYCIQIVTLNVLPILFMTMQIKLNDNILPIITLLISTPINFFMVRIALKRQIKK